MDILRKNLQFMFVNMHPQGWKSQKACQNSKQETLTASSDLGLHCLSRPFWQATSLLKF